MKLIICVCLLFITNCSTVLAADKPVANQLAASKTKATPRNNIGLPDTVARVYRGSSDDQTGLYSGLGIIKKTVSSTQSTESLIPTKKAVKIIKLSTPSVAVKNKSKKFVFKSIK